jgi:NAD(P)-dependent dehydrogenase (short-subunit alcohol dehydrogenase family)
MDLAGKVAVVTGGAHGIGRALCRRFAAAGARVCVVDRDAAGAVAVAGEIAGLGLACDVRDEAQLRGVVAETERRIGPIDLFCSNAGVAYGDGGPGATDGANENWQRCWDINVMAHVYAARAVLPGMIGRGGGYLLQTVSAAGLLSQIGDAAYSTTKHAAIGFAESLAISHGDQGVRVSVVCPQYVATGMVGVPDDSDYGARPELMSPEHLADLVVDGLAAERFLILPHPEVADYRRRKCEDYDRWLGGMRKLRRALISDAADFSLENLTRLPGGRSRS